MNEITALPVRADGEGWEVGSSAGGSRSMRSGEAGREAGRDSSPPKADIVEIGSTDQQYRNRSVVVIEYREVQSRIDGGLC